MVVVSGTWVKNVATFPTPALNDMVISSDSKMTAKAVLICRPNSHPFQERTLALDQPVKVGRSVARARATATNAIFDCKVLSRHHALLWYENGKFFLQDTKSSNGTFVNNNRLTADLEHHEVSSGDIVQFGVDVIENNRKVTHGCIIATLKLYLPDGKEAKASPSIVENNSQVVPLDELYKLHSIIQEATQREQCLESKLITLQSIVDEARKSAEESWQAYVGEERLLSRVSALETQLQQAGKNWSEDKYREEISKLQDDSAAYQVAAKEAMEKLHSERLQALSAATEQERCRISAEQEVLLAKEQLSFTQQELENVAKQLSDEQKAAKEERTQLEELNWDLQSRLEHESGKVQALGLKLCPNVFDISNMDVLDIIDSQYDAKAKKELLANNENCESEMNKANGVSEEKHDINRIPVIFDEEETKEDSSEKSLTETNSEDEESSSLPETIIDDEKSENDKRVTFNLQDESIEGTQNGGGDYEEKDSSLEENEKDDFDTDSIDSKTLKYKYQSAQNELKRRIEFFESLLESNKTKINELEKSLESEKEANSSQECENQALKDELVILQQKWKESSNENQQLKDKVNVLVRDSQKRTESSALSSEDQQNAIISTAKPASGVSYEEFVNLEEELVMLKQRYAQTNDEKLKLHHDLASLREQYNKMCNSSYDKMYFYMAPLILMILYLVISAMIS